MQKKSIKSLENAKKHRKVTKNIKSNNSENSIQIQKSIKLGTKN